MFSGLLARVSKTSTSMNTSAQSLSLFTPVSLLFKDLPRPRDLYRGLRRGKVGGCAHVTMKLTPSSPMIPNWDSSPFVHMIGSVSLALRVAHVSEPKSHALTNRISLVLWLPKRSVCSPIVNKSLESREVEEVSVAGRRE